MQAQETIHEQEREETHHEIEPLPLLDLKQRPNSWGSDYSEYRIRDKKVKDIEMT